MRSMTMMAAAMAASAPAALFASEAAAQRYDFVVAHSRFSNGSITAPVRPVAYGYQVRLPSGTWIKCRRSCSETLRVETIDLHEALHRNSSIGEQAAECGIFGCLELRWPR